MSHIVIAVLSEAWHRFGSFPAARQGEITEWVMRRVREIQEGGPQASVAHPTLPRTFEPSWYEPSREPGSDDE